MHPPEFFFNKIVRSFNIIYDNDTQYVSVTIQYVIDNHCERYLISYAQYEELCRGYTNQYYILDALCSGYFTLYRRLRNQITQQIHDDQCDATQQGLMAIPPNMREPFPILENRRIDYVRETCTVEPTLIDEVPWTVNTGGTYNIPLEPFGMYGGCDTCYHFSMVFGGRAYGKRSLAGKIETEEDFEIVKSDFVEHFNKAHPDLVAKKRADKPVKKKFEKMEDKIFTTSTPFNSSGSFFHSLAHEADTFLQEYNCQFTSSAGNELFSEEDQPVEEPHAEHVEERRGFRSRRTNRYEVQ